MSDPAHEWGLLKLAIQTLTRLPVAAPFGPDALRQATRYFPLVGAGVGLVAWAVFALARVGLPAGLASILSLGATLLLTGALHEDGVADCADALFGGRTRADALRIMRDSRVGAFGVLGLGIVLAAKVLAAASLDGGPALVAGHAAGRFWAIVSAAAMPYARQDGMAAGVAAPGATELGMAALFGLGPVLLLGPRAPAALLLSGAVALGLGAWARRRLGGYTGDVLGMVQVCTEAAILLAALWHAG